jgi:Uma2 family endonuclease
MLVPVGSQQGNVSARIVAIQKLFTVAEYDLIPDPPGGRYELHHGELVFTPWPERLYYDLRYRLRKLLEPTAEAAGFLADTSYPYRPLPENELWGAHVACVRQSRHASTDLWLMGSPELVIEVSSILDPELNDKAMTTLGGDGAVEFWIVDPHTTAVKVYSRTSGVQIHREGAVPNPLFDCPITLETLFAEDVY